MIALEDMKNYINKRVVLTSCSNVSYTGIVQEILPLQGKHGLLVRLDPRSGFSIWCPLDFIKGLLAIPIAE